MVSFFISFIFVLFLFILCPCFFVFFVFVFGVDVPGMFNSFCLCLGFSVLYIVWLMCLFFCLNGF